SPSFTLIGQKSFTTFSRSPFARMNSTHMLPPRLCCLPASCQTRSIWRDSRTAQEVMTESPTELPPVPTHVAETVDAIAKLHARSERDVPRQQRSVEAFTAHLGQPMAVWAIAAAAVCWMGLNVTLPLAGFRPPDPPPF